MRQGSLLKVVKVDGIFFLDLELEEAFLYISNLPSGNTTDFTYYLSYTMAKKNVIFYAIMYSLPTSL